MTSTRARDLAGIGLVLAAISWALVRQYYGAIPPLRWYVPLSLGLLGVAELMLARILRERVRGQSGLPTMEALMAARALALAKASAVAGAGFVGVWLGFLAFTVPNVGRLASASSDTLTGVIGVAASALLVTGALVLENACRTPAPPKEREERRDNM